MPRRHSLETRGSLDEVASQAGTPPRIRERNSESGDLGEISRRPLLFIVLSGATLKAALGAALVVVGAILLT